MIYRVAYKWCGRREDAEDITQEVCIKLAEAIHSFRGDAKFSSWLYRLTLNAVRDAQRRDGRKGTVALPEELLVEDGSLSAEEGLQLQQCWQAVLGLESPEKDAVLLVFSEGLSHKQAAEVLGCAESTVSWYIHQARKQLNEWRARHG